MLKNMRVLKLHKIVSKLHNGVLKFTQGGNNLKNVLKKHFFVKGRKELSVMVHNYREKADGTPIVILCHGFTGDKIGPNQLILNLAKGIEAAGYIAIRFDFAGSGESYGEFSKDTTISGWQQDLDTIVSWVKNSPEFSGSPIILCGHSLGGLIALSYPKDDAIKGRMALSSVVHPVETFSAEGIFGKELWDKAVSGKTISNFFNKAFTLDDGIFVADMLHGNYKPLEVTDTYSTPLLIIHGTEDCAVPISGSEELYKRYKGEKVFHKLKGIDHIYINKHHIIQSLIVEWLKKYF